MMLYDTYASPLGAILVTANGDQLTGLYFEGQKYHPERAPAWTRDPHAAIMKAVREQLAAYFQGDSHAFDLPLAPVGTPFQQAVWTELVRIPFGDTSTYGAIAGTLGKPDACRAVGAAVGRNPISIVIPCHRVVGGKGALTGYAGGLDRKRALLELEAPSSNRLFPKGTMPTLRRA